MGGVEITKLIVGIVYSLVAISIPVIIVSMFVKFIMEAVWNLIKKLVSLHRKSKRTGV